MSQPVSPSDLTAQKRNHIDIPKPISSNRNRITVVTVIHEAQGGVEKD